MIARRNLALLALLGLLVAAEIALRPPAVDPRDVGPLLPGLTSEAAARLRVEAPGRQDPTPEVLHLARVEGGWVVEEAFGFPALGSRVDASLNGLTGLTTLDLVSEVATSHADYGLQSSSSARVTVYDEGGATLADLLIGDRAPGGQASYVRRFGEDAVYRAPRLRSRPTAGVQEWIEARWLPWDRPDLLTTRIELAGASMGGGPLVLERLVSDASSGGAPTWLRGDGERVAPSSVRSFLNALTSLTVTRVLDEGHDPEALGEVQLEVTLTRASGEPWRARIGGAAPDGGRVGTRADGDWTVVLLETLVNEVIERARGLR